jgi:hypothetical protein
MRPILSSTKVIGTTACTCLAVALGACASLESRWSRADASPEVLHQDFQICVDESSAKVPKNMENMSRSYFSSPETHCENVYTLPQMRCEPDLFTSEVRCETIQLPPVNRCETKPGEWIVPMPDYQDQNAATRYKEFSACMKAKGYISTSF